MKKKRVMGVLWVLSFAAVAFGDPNTQIRYETTDLGSNRWQYTYDVKNINMAGEIEEFTIWFDYGLYENLTIETADPPVGDWDEVVWDPEPVLEDDGAYDAKTLSLGIDIDETVSGFAVSFDWLGIGNPGSQEYHIVDPDNYPVPIETGYTVPEPGTLLLLGLGAIICFPRQRRP